MVRRIAEKEVLEMVRDRRFAWSAAVLFALLAGSLLAGWRHFADIAAQHEQARQLQRELWLNKGEMNPHGAAHYGAFAFKPTAELSAVDPGLDPFVGVSVFLEAHKQNLARYRPVEDATPLARLGSLTASVTLQLLVPLLIIGLTFTAFAGEREQGTLRQLMSLGVPRAILARGKALAVILPLALILVPAAGVGAVAMALYAGRDGMALSLSRAGAMTLVYLAYYAIWIGIGLAVSAMVRSSRAALVVLLTLWFTTSFIAPRLAASAAGGIEPTPTAVAFAEAIERDKAALTPWDVLVKQTTAELLIEHGVDDVKKLPVNPEGVALVKGEKADTAVHDRHFQRLAGVHTKQAGLYQAGAMFAPLVAVQSLSMALAGTDYSHYRDFLDAAERYRSEFIRVLNADVVTHQKPDTWDYKRGRDLWEQVPPFQYQLPGAGWALSHQKLSVVLLAAWVVAVAFAARAALGRIDID
jgi:ABC-2 type transport system permease protein